MGTEVAIVSLIVSMASTAYSISENRQAGKKQQEAQDISTAQQNL